ncbi:MAG: hypothetical protein IKQ13_10470 [Treponema sp.]|nr:hypothetical protein [Treponema sp.]
MKTFLLPLAAVALLTGCSFSVPDSAPEERGAAFSANSERSVLLSGSIKFSGAIPSAFKSNSSGRTAFPTAPTPLVYKIKATSGSSVIEFNSSEASSGGSITVDGDTITFTISLTSGTWALTASAEDSSGNKVLATKNAVSVPLTGDSPSVSLGDPLVLNYASSSSTGKGNIGLTISCDSGTNIQSIKVNPLTSGITSTTSNTTSDWLWSQSNVNPGSYKVEFLFYSGTDCSGTILYRINEVVNIYSNLTTDTFEDASYVSSGHIEITGSLLASAELVTIYVSSSGSDSGTGSYFSPVKTLKQAVTLVNNSSAAATTEFEIFVRDNVSLGGSTTLNSGKKASITSEGSSAVTVSGGSSHDSLTISGEAEVSNLNFSGLGGINVSGTKLTINDSTVKNGTSVGGGGFFVGSGAELVSEQGLVISNCEATGSFGCGGGIYNTGTVSLTGCEISSCTAAVSGSSIYNSATGSLTLGGETSIDGSIYLQSNAHPLDLDSTFSTTDEIQIELKTGSLSTEFSFGNTVISNATATQAACFTTPDGSDYSLEFVATSGTVIMNSAARFIIYVGGTGASDETGDGSNSKPYATLEKSLEVAAERYTIDNGEYSIYVKDTITLTRNIEITGLPDLTLAGNVAATSTSTETINGGGYNIKFSCDATVRNLEFYGLGASSTTAGPITIASGKEVEAENVKVTSCTNTGGDGGGIYNAGTLTLKNCTVSGCEASAWGGGIYCGHSSSLTLENTTVSGNRAILGGGICIGISCNAQITDSTIQSNSAESTTLGTFGGGGIFINDGGSLTLSGDDSKIILNTAKSTTTEKIPHGGGVLCRGSMTMEGGIISQNEVIADFASGYGYGGGVALEPTGPTSSGTFTMSGGSISRNDATFGGGIANRGLNLVLSGGTIGDALGNTASYGGGVYVGAFNFGTEATPNLKEATCTISDCTIESNTASAYGGGIFSEDSSITFNSGSVEFNKVESTSIDYIGGGGIYIKYGTLTFGGTGEIKNNYADTTKISAAGGGLYIYEGGIVNMDGGSIKANYVKSPSGLSGCAQGGGVYISGSGKMTLSDGTISENKAYSTTSGQNSMGGGVFVYMGGEMTMTGGSIKDNGYTASTILGGGIYSFGSLTITNGTITSNKATSGGGIYLNLITTGTSSLTYGGTTITGNDADGFGSVGDNYYINSGVVFSGSLGAITSPVSITLPTALHD